MKPKTPHKEKQHVGDIILTRSSRGEFSIEVQDRKSRVHILDLEIPPSKMGDLLSRRPVKCKFILRPKYLGWTPQNKTEQIPFPRHGYAAAELEAAITAALKPFEVDGWRGRREHFTNSERHKDGICSVSFHRFVQ